MRTGLTVFLLLTTLVTVSPLARPASMDEQDQRARYARLLQRKLLLQREAQLKELQMELAENRNRKSVSMCA
jgi:hypothetical protein